MLEWNILFFGRLGKRSEKQNLDEVHASQNNECRQNGGSEDSINAPKLTIRLKGNEASDTQPEKVPDDRDTLQDFNASEA
jgi:hypothetical protein